MADRQDPMSPLIAPAQIELAEKLAEAERLVAQGRTEHAAACYRALHARYPDSADVLFGLATVEQQMGLLATSRTRYEATLQAPGVQDSASLRALIERRIGMVSYQLGQAPRAVRHWQRAHELEPDPELLGWIEEVRPSCGPLVSVIVTVYNYARYLNDSIGSILAQTYKNFELIVVNDCSTDDTDAVVAELRTRYDFKYLTNPVNRGVSYTLNVGSTLATGKYIIAFDADDILLPDAMAAHVDNLESHPAAGLSYGRMYVLAADGKKTEEPMPEMEGEIFDFILCGTFILPCMAMYRADVWRLTPGYDEATSLQDLDIELHLLRHSQGARLDQFVTYYRRHAGSASDLKLRNAQKKSYRGRAVVLNKWRDEPMYDLAWMHRWTFHDKAITDDVVAEMIDEGDSDDYLHYRASLAKSKAGDWQAALAHAELSKSFVRRTAYVASPIYAQYLSCLKHTGQEARALKLARRALSLGIEFKTAEFIWAAAEYLLSAANTRESNRDPHAFDTAVKLYKECLRIGEPPRLYCSIAGTGSYLAAHRLGQLHVISKKYTQALEYFRKACEYGYEPAFIAHGEARRKAGLMPRLWNHNESA